MKSIVGMEITANFKGHSIEQCGSVTAHVDYPLGVALSQRIRKYYLNDREVTRPEMAFFLWGYNQGLAFAQAA